jgi:hypothetical protein
LENLNIDENIILKWILEIMWEEMYWIYLAQNRGCWLALVKKVINFRVP